MMGSRAGLALGRLAPHCPPLQSRPCRSGRRRGQDCLCLLTGSRETPSTLRTEGSSFQRGCSEPACPTSSLPRQGCPVEMGLGIRRLSFRINLAQTSKSSQEGAASYVVMVSSLAGRFREGCVLPVRPANAALIQPRQKLANSPPSPAGGSSAAGCGLLQEGGQQSSAPTCWAQAGRGLAPGSRLDTRPTTPGGLLRPGPAWPSGPWPPQGQPPCLQASPTQAGHRAA